MPPKSNNTVTETKKQPEGPQKFIKPGKVVILTQGRQAGKKAVIVRNFDEGKQKKYPFAIVAGIERYPRKVLKSWDKKKIAMRSRIKPFLKTINYTHFMPTRYGLDIDFKNIVTPQVLSEQTKKESAKRKVKRLFEERYLSGKNKWFFTKLRF